MQLLFSADEVSARDRYRKWREFSDERFMPMVHTRTDQYAFDASAEGVQIGDLAITRASFNAIKLETTPQTIRHPLNKPDVLGFSIKLSGKCILDQFGRTMEQGDGELSIVDANKPFHFVHLDHTDHIIIQIPRQRLESMLGPASNFAAISMRGSVPALLVKTFFRDLLSVHESLRADSAARMASVGVDLITASIAETMARESPKPIQGTIAVQHAKFYIESNLHDPDLAPSSVAAAVGVSLRQLQMLFREREQHVADWIWHRRLDTAAKRLADPAFRHLSLGALADGCGFVNQAHFSRRFKECYGVSPGEYRRSFLK